MKANARTSKTMCQLAPKTYTWLLKCSGRLHQSWCQGGGILIQVPDKFRATLLYEPSGCGKMMTAISNMGYQTQREMKQQFQPDVWCRINFIRNHNMNRTILYKNDVRSSLSWLSKAPPITTPWLWPLHWLKAAFLKVSMPKPEDSQYELSPTFCYIGKKCYIMATHRQSPHKRKAYARNTFEGAFRAFVLGWYSPFLRITRTRRIWRMTKATIRKWKLWFPAVHWAVVG